MFMPHPNLSEELNSNIVESEIEGGVFINDLPPSTVLEIQTMHHCYTAVFLGGSQALISGHPEFCPRPVPVAIAGSTWGGSVLKMRFVGRGMHLEFHHPEYRTPIVTSGNPGVPAVGAGPRSPRWRRSAPLTWPRNSPNMAPLHDRPNAL